MLSTSTCLALASASRTPALPTRWFSTLRAAVCAGLGLAVAMTAAAAQQPTPGAIELSSVVMSRWLVVQKEFSARLNADRAAGKPELEQSEAESETFLNEACTKAGFASTDECSCTIGYVGVLVSGYDPRTGRYGDPAAAAERRIADIEANPKMSQAAKEEALAINRQALEILRQVLPGPVPEAHLELMNAYHDRIVEANR
jgi:hypothetical protein